MYFFYKFNFLFVKFSFLFPFQNRISLYIPWLPGAHYVAHAGFDYKAILFQPSKDWDYRHEIKFPF